MGPADSKDTQRLLRHVIEVAKKGGLSQSFADTLLAAADMIEAPPEGSVVVKDWECVIEAGPQLLGNRKDIFYAMRERADEEGVPVRFTYYSKEFIIAPGEDVDEFLFRHPR